MITKVKRLDSPTRYDKVRRTTNSDDLASEEQNPCFDYIINFHNI